MRTIITLLLISLSVGLDNFATSIAMGVSGIKKSRRIRIALFFGFFETLMALIGILLGKQALSILGDKAHIIGGILLGLTGMYQIYSSFKNEIENNTKKDIAGTWNLFFPALALSIDNLIVGFSLGARHLNVVQSILAICAASLLLSSLGLEIGNRIRKVVEEYSEIIAGSILILVGVLVFTKVL